MTSKTDKNRHNLPGSSPTEGTTASGLVRLLRKAAIQLEPGSHSDKPRSNAIQENTIKNNPVQASATKQAQGQADTESNQAGQPGPATKGQAGLTETSNAAATESSAQTAVVAPAVASDADGNVNPEKKEGSSRRGGRRRRSPYKTGGAKPRPEQTDSQTQTAEAGSPMLHSKAASDSKPTTERKRPETSQQTRLPEQAQPVSEALRKPDTTKTVADKPATGDGISS